MGRIVSALIVAGVIGWLALNRQASNNPTGIDPETAGAMQARQTYEDQLRIDGPDTEQIIDARSIFLFNVTTHDLLFFSGQSLTCKGAKVLGYDNEPSGLKKSKKVIETLEKVMSSTACNCRNVFELLPNKKRPVPRTVSPNYLLLKVIR